MLESYCESESNIKDDFFRVHLGDRELGKGDTCQTKMKVVEILTEALVPVALLKLENEPTTCVRPIVMMAEPPTDGDNVDIYGKIHIYLKPMLLFKFII